MKIFVGTLYSGENEFEECLDSIHQQTYKNYEHFIFKNLPNKEAHATLFQSFLDKAKEFDLLIKVDADIVLSNERIFENIVQKMEMNPWLDVFTIKVYDFFSDQLISGLATYRNNVHWNFDTETMFVDVPLVPANRWFTDDIEFAPAAIHCKNPSPYHAFHYGVHRGLKSIQWMIHSATHWFLLEKVWENYLRTKDTRIGLAIMGRELVYSGLLRKDDVSYTNPRLNTILEAYLSLDGVRLEREIRKLKLSNWGILPSNLRRRWIRRLRSENPTAN